MSTGGSGGGGTTNVAQFLPPAYTATGWGDYINNATAITQTPYQQYYGMQIAPINNAQVQGMQLTANLAGNNAPDYATARAMNQLTAAGAYENPYSTIQTQMGVNPWAGATTNVGTNQYSGFSPDYGAFKQQSMDDVIRAYQTGTAAQTDSAFNRAGAFHGGGHDAQIAANEYGLGKNLQNMSSNMDFQQWQNSAGLQENALNRDVGAQQTDLSRNANLANSMQQMGLQAQQGDLNRASQYWAQERQNQIGSLPAAIQAGQFDMSQANALTGVGDAQRQYQQDMLNQQYNNYNQWQQFPYQMLDAYGAALSRASGNYGANTAQSQTNYQASPLAQLIGGGLLGAGIYQGFGG